MPNGCRLEKPASCSGCPLAPIGRGFSEPDGYGSNGVLVIGEALGRYEAQDGYPFRPYAEAGSLLDRAFGMCGMKRASFVIYNVVNCQPPGNELTGAYYEQGAIEHCRQHLLAVVEKYRPKALLVLGAVALRALTGMAGERLNLEYLNGFALTSNIELDGRSLPAVISYHPSHIKRGAWALLPVLVKAIHFAVEVAKHGTPSTADLEYVEHATPGMLEDLRDYLHNNPDVPLSTDVETNYAELKDRLFDEDPEMTAAEAPKIIARGKQEVTQVNFSVKEKTALVTSMTPTNKGLVKEIHATENLKVGHNIIMFDMDVCVDNDVAILGPIADTMWMFHHMYPDLPGKRGKMTGTGTDQAEDGSVANLQFCASFYGFPIPWKHLSNAMPEWYGGCDADAALRVFWGAFDDMTRLGVYEQYQRMTADVLPILVKMGKRGIPINRAALMELHAHLFGKIKHVDIEIQQYAPKELLPLHPQTGWKKAPKNAAVGAVVNVKKKKGNETVIIPATLIEIDVELKAETKNCCMRARKPSKKTGMVDQKYLDSPHAHIRGGDGKTIKPCCACPEDLHEALLAADDLIASHYCHGCRSNHDLRGLASGVLFSPNPDCVKCGGTGILLLPKRTERRWAGELPFNAASPNQMWSYVHFRGYKVTKNSKREMAMDAETIEKLAKQYGDPIFNLAVKKRRFVKLDSTYCIGWMPGDDGRVHPSVGPYPATGQLSGRRPNPQNVPNLSKIVDPEMLELSSRFRDTMHAEADYIVGEADFKSFHVQTLGYEAGDPVYIGLAKTDIHSFFAVAGILRLEDRDTLLADASANLNRGQADKELGAKLKWYRKNHVLKNGTSFETLRNKQAKVAILAYGLGQQEGSLYRQNQESFSSQNEAKIVMDGMNTTFPKISRYRDAIPLTVKPNGWKLINRFGFVRWFFDVQRLNRRKGQMDHGDDWEAAIAFNPQGSAHGHMRVCMVRDEQLGYNDLFGFDNTVHDSFRFHFHKSLLEQWATLIPQVMQHESEVMVMPWDEGRGLSVEVELKIGKSWGRDMREFSL